MLTAQVSTPENFILDAVFDCGLDMQHIIGDNSSIDLKSVYV